MKKFTFFIVFLSIFFPSVLPANILFFFAGGNVSMKNSAWPWVLELAKRGHNVTFLSPHEKTPTSHPNITDLASAPLQKLAGALYTVDWFKIREESKEKIFNYNYISGGTCKAVVENRLTDPSLSKVFQSSFDLVVVNAIFNECGFFVAKYFKAKVITYVPCTIPPWHYDIYGITPEVAWIPDLYLTAYTIPMGLLERAYNVYWEIFWSWHHEDLSPILEKITEPLLVTENTASLRDIENSVSVVLVNAHPSIDFARTFPPLYVDVGGIGIATNSKTEMPKDYKDFMDSSGTGGAVLITFGSAVLLNKMSERYQKMFFDMVNALPQVNFLMRWIGPLPGFLEDHPKNLLLSDWLPQKEILSHPKLKLFVTHGGISGIQEATYNGVPICVMPLFADQDYNAYRVVAQEVGERYEIRGMTTESLISTIEKVLNDDKYKKNMMRKSALFKDRPLSPVDTAVFWTEFALRHNDTISTLRPQNQHLNMLQRRLADVFLLFELIVLVAIAVIIFTLKVTVKLLRKVFRGNSEQRKTEKAD